MLIVRLEAADYRVVRASSMEFLHTLLETHSFDAVLISRRFAETHGLDASWHLRDAHSDHAIIVWDRDESGSVSSRIFGNPDIAQPIYPSRPDYLAAARNVAAALETETVPTSLTLRAPKPSPTEPSRRPAEKEPGLPHERQPEPTIHELHKKAALILDAIASGGKRGADIPTISHTAWGTGAIDHKKDIQIYVSKLRKFLTTRDGPPCSIAWRDKRYYLMSRP